MQFKKLLLAGAATTALAATAHAGVLAGPSDTGLTTPSVADIALSGGAIAIVAPYDVEAIDDASVVYEFEGSTDPAFSTFNGGTFTPGASGSITFTLNGASFDGDPTIPLTCATPAAFAQQAGGDGSTSATFTLNGGNCVALNGPTGSNNLTGQATGNGTTLTANVIDSATVVAGGTVGDGDVIGLGNLAVSSPTGANVTVAFARILDPGDSDTAVTNVAGTGNSVPLLNVVTIPNVSQVAIIDAEAVAATTGGARDPVAGVETLIDIVNGSTAVNNAGTDEIPVTNGFTTIAYFYLLADNGDADAAAGGSANGAQNGTAPADPAVTALADSGSLNFTVSGLVLDALDATVGDDGIFFVNATGAPGADLSEGPTGVFNPVAGNDPTIEGVSTGVDLDACNPATAAILTPTVDIDGEDVSVTGLPVGLLGSAGASAADGEDPATTDQLILCLAFDGATEIPEGSVTFVNGTLQAGNVTGNPAFEARAFSGAEHVIGFGGSETEVAYAVGSSALFTSFFQIRNLSTVAGPVTARVEFAQEGIDDATGVVIESLGAGDNVLIGLDSQVGDIPSILDTLGTDLGRDFEAEGFSGSASRAAVVFSSTAEIQATGLLTSFNNVVGEVGTEYARPDDVN